jgi:hypothetical protein
MPAYNCCPDAGADHRDLPAEMVDHVIALDRPSRADIVAVVQLLTPQVLVPLCAQPRQDRRGAGTGRWLAGRCAIKSRCLGARRSAGSLHRATTSVATGGTGQGRGGE